VSSSTKGEGGKIASASDGGQERGVERMSSQAKEGGKKKYVKGENGRPAPLSEETLIMADIAKKSSRREATNISVKNSEIVARSGEGKKENDLRQNVAEPQTNKYSKKTDCWKQ